MKLYVLRHGKSPQLSEAKVDRDEDRPLAPEGREATARMAAYLKDQGGHPERILTSPLARARDTAREAAKVLRGPKPEETAVLDGHLGVGELWERLLQALGPEAEAMIVGHQPQLGELVAYLTGSSVEIKPAGLVALERTDDRVRILWSKNPKDLP